VGFGVGADADVMALYRVCQREEILLESIQINDQGGSVDLLQPLPDRGRCPHG